MVERLGVGKGEMAEIMLCCRGERAACRAVRKGESGVTVCERDDVVEER